MFNFFDSDGHDISHLCRVAAAPHSINILDPVNSSLFSNSCGNAGTSLADVVRQMSITDCRVPENLVNGENGRSSKSWIAPLRASLDPMDMNPNVVYFSFDRPVSLGLVKIWNYSKDLERGVSDFELWADDKLLFRGGLGKGAEGQAVIFTNNEEVRKSESRNVLYCGNQQQEVLLINERQVVGASAYHLQRAMPRGVGAYHGDQPDLSKRPQTSMRVNA